MNQWSLVVCKLLFFFAPGAYGGGNAKTFNTARLQVLDYTNESRESYNKEQISLNEKMQEYKKQVDEECRLSLNGPNSPKDSVQPFSRISNEVVDSVMESAKNGKVLSDEICLLP